ncbi:MAG TPA: hypothetical protein VF916_05800 [Ktedonobacterales bacterium]
MSTQEAYMGRIFSIDPGPHTGCAWFENGQFVKTLTLYHEQNEQLYLLLSRMLSACASEKDHVTVVIEQFTTNGPISHGGLATVKLIGFSEREQVPLLRAQALGITATVTLDGGKPPVTLDVQLSRAMLDLWDTLLQPIIDEEWASVTAELAGQAAPTVTPPEQALSPVDASYR